MHNEPSTPGQSGVFPGSEPGQTSSVAASTRKDLEKRLSRERTRATRACDRCKSKKARCSGTHPCTICTAKGLDCQYRAVYRRGRPPEIPSEVAVTSQSHLSEENDHPRHLSSVTISNTTQHGVDETMADDESHLVTRSRGQSLTSDVDRSRESQNSAEPLHTDADGHFIGPSSGLSFLIRAKKRVREMAVTRDQSSIFTFGDLPLPEVDHTFLDLPTQEEAYTLLATYFDFAFPTHRFLHRSTTEEWLKEFYLTRRSISLPPGAREQNAIVLMALAQAKLYSPVDNDGHIDIENSATLYAASENQLAREVGEIRLTSVQSRLAQCFFLLSQSRVNQCWSLFGTTARLALAIGLHRRRRSGKGYNMIEGECRKRVFWCAYSLDGYLSASLGRPKIFHDSDIDQDLPGCIDDCDLFPTRIQTRSLKSHSVMLAPIYHARLSKIISGVLKDLYGIHHLDISTQAGLVEKHSRSLGEWRRGIADFLDVQWTNASLLIPPFSRQCTVLNLAYAHAVILAHRPLLTDDLTTLDAASSPEDDRLGSIIRDGKQACIGAAKNILTIVIDLCEGNRMFGAYWFTHYYAFSALVVLYVSMIRDSKDSSDCHDDWSQILFDAQKCQNLLSTRSAQSPFAQRYGIVLEELRADAVNRVQPRNTATNGTPDHESWRGEQPQASTIRQSNESLFFETSTQLDHSNGLGMGTSGLNSWGPYEPTAHPSIAQNAEHMDILSQGNGSNLDSSSLFTDFTGWGDLDSLVTAGAGNEMDLFISALATDQGQAR